MGRFRRLFNCYVIFFLHRNIYYQIQMHLKEALFVRHNVNVIQFCADIQSYFNTKKNGAENWGKYLEENAIKAEQMDDRLKNQGN